MFAPASPHRAPPSQMLSGLYRQVGVETGVKTADPHKLVLMLYDGLLEAIAQARGAMRARQIEAKNRAMTRAVRIVDEGLKPGLSPAGGELSTSLSSLYAYVSMRLMQAHARNDEAALDECRRLITPLRDAWATIGERIPS
ncbi:MAG: flagellar export chaperone FliS [Burkholderiales bacterium]|nr:flagellar export chaperone FliS [Burkholderiales bacterium]